MDNTEKLNEQLSEYIESNCNNCYVQILDDGRIHLDDKFKLDDLTKVMDIMGYKLTKKEETPLPTKGHEFGESLLQ